MASKKSENNTKPKIIKKFPANENLILKFINGDDTIFYIANNQINQNYVIYKEVDNGYEKLGTGKTPPELEKKYIKIIRKNSEKKERKK